MAVKRQANPGGEREARPRLEGVESCGKNEAKIGAEMMAHRSLRGSAKAKVAGPPARSVAVRSSRTNRSEGATGVEVPAKDLARKIQGSVASVALAATLVTGAGQFATFPPEARAELNQYEYERGGEFNRGSAKQFGGIEMKKVDIVEEYGQDLRLSNFVQADIRDAKLRKANLRGAYMMKVSEDWRLWGLPHENTHTSLVLDSAAPPPLPRRID